MRNPIEYGSRIIAHTSTETQPHDCPPPSYLGQHLLALRRRVRVVVEEHGVGQEARVDHRCERLGVGGACCVGAESRPGQAHK